MQAQEHIIQQPGSENVAPVQAEGPPTIAGFIEAAGKRDLISGFLGLSPSAVSNWLLDGIPTKHYGNLVKFGREQSPAIPWLTFEYLHNLNQTHTREKRRGR
jgi:hypothetical protein